MPRYVRCVLCLCACETLGRGQSGQTGRYYNGLATSVLPPKHLHENPSRLKQGSVKQGSPSSEDNDSSMLFLLGVFQCVLVRAVLKGEKTQKFNLPSLLFQASQPSRTTKRKESKRAPPYNLHVLITFLSFFSLL